MPRCFVVDEITTGALSTTLMTSWRLRLANSSTLSNRYWLTGQNEIDSILTSAQNMLAVLDQIRQVRNRINTIGAFAVRRRASWRLDDLTKPLGAAPLADQDVTDFKARLAKLDEWCIPDKTDLNYWADVLISIKGRISEINDNALSALPDEVKKTAEKLREGLAKLVQTPPATLNEAIAAEDNYARLTILWMSRDNDQLLSKLSTLKENAPVEKYYQIVDDWGWERIRGLSQASDGLTIDGPPATADSLRTFSPITLRLLAPGEPELIETYLMQKKLIYSWTIEIETQKTSKLSSGSQVTRSIVLEVESTEPQVAQYSPEPGKLKAAVRIKYQGRDGEGASIKEPITIIKSNDFRVWQIFETADVLSFILVMLMSIVTGIGLYALTPTFGSFKEYLTLFTWGAGLDQGKNFIQSLAAYKKN